MATANSGVFSLMVSYEWTLKNVGGDFKTFATKMILFRGERVFRVGLQNLNQPILVFIAINLNKIGMKVQEVTYSYGPEDATETTAGSCQIINMQKSGDDINLQLFTSNLSKRIAGNGKFAFQIFIEGSVNTYSYQLSDRLLKDQLWAAVLKNQQWADVELLVKGKKFSAHKAVLAARSPVFAAEFAKDDSEETIPYRVEISGVDPSTAEQFLHFLYTGEPIKPILGNEELLKLADTYQLTTLANLCRIALKKVDPQQAVNIVSTLQLNAADSAVMSSLSINKQEKETEIFFDPNASTFRSPQLQLITTSTKLEPKSFLQYEDEKVFFSQFKGQFIYPNYDAAYYGGPHVTYLRSPSFHFISAKHRNYGLKVVDASCFCESNWTKMERKNAEQDAELLLFTSKILRDVNVTSMFFFYINIVKTIENHCFGMVDTDWATALWSAAIERKLTDVDIMVGSNKLEAHRVILSARSPVFCALLSKISNTGKSTIVIGDDFELPVVEHFLKFLYTGSLDVSSSNQQLLGLAELYEVETLKKICHAGNLDYDVEEYTNSLLLL